MRSLSPSRRMACAKWPRPSIHSTAFIPLSTPTHIYANIKKIPPTKTVILHGSASESWSFLTFFCIHFLLPHWPYIFVWVGPVSRSTRLCRSWPLEPLLLLCRAPWSVINKGALFFSWEIEWQRRLKHRRKCVYNWPEQSSSIFTRVFLILSCWFRPRPFHCLLVPTRASFFFLFLQQVHICSHPPLLPAPPSTAGLFLFGCGHSAFFYGTLAS